ncbi:thermonuclease family protein [Bacillus changyiensis]|uniref:thermonuclease family protein n=1 Tax=Bacillus changyiensis TaxID=3004103 RepID=UPI0022E5C7D5|nr:thermonuclease family protein [Bacillus changyiensis]MDA1477507.1 thermonuclease family protein [Bacillus changyiensis]
MKKWILACIAFIISFSLAGCAFKDQGEKKVLTAQKVTKTQKEQGKVNSTKRVSVTLVHAVDGDTIKVKYKGKEKTVRYLLVDTPETKKPNTCVQPYGKDASKKNRELVSKGKLQLEFDKGNRTDKYGRLLAYVYVDGRSVQENLLKAGLARVAYVYPPNTKYVKQYKKVESIAKNNNIGIWRHSSYVTNKGFKGCAVSTSKKVKKSKPAPKQSAPKKRVASQVFKNCTELRKKYPNGVPRSHPAYQSKFDRDHDQYACER